MIQKEVHDIIVELAKKFNKPVYVIEEIYLSQWKFLKEKVSQEGKLCNEFKTIKLPKWGKYYLSESKLAHIKRHKEENERRRIENTKSSNQTNT